MKITTNAKGQLAVSKAEIRAFEKGFLPSRPLYDARYDLIIDKEGKLERIQVKYANGKPTNTDGAVVVKLEYVDRIRNSYTYRNEEVDALIVYIPRLDRLCYLPKKVFLGKKKISLRVSPPKNRQKVGIIAAADYYW